MVTSASASLDVSQDVKPTAARITANVLMVGDCRIIESALIIY